MKKKIIIGSIIAVVIIVLASFSSVVAIDTKKNRGNGEILYVGGTGEGNYTRIQDAIDNASDGDTVFVYDDSSPYYENVVVNKSINLIGEDKDTTIIDGTDGGHIVRINTERVTIKNFTIQNGIWNSSGIFVQSHHNIISNNIIKTGNNQYGIFLDGASFNKISNNIIKNRDKGIWLRSTSSDNEIHDNKVENCRIGIGLYEFTVEPTFYNNSIKNNFVTSSYQSGIWISLTDTTILSGNVVFDSKIGIEIYHSFNFKVFKNNIIRNVVGILSSAHSKGVILNNNFFINIIHAYFHGEPEQINWSRNYWGRPRIFRKPILGAIYGTATLNFDEHPRLLPYLRIFDRGGLLDEFHTY